MKLSFLLLSALLALSSASLQDIVKQSSQHRNVSLLNPDLKDRVPEIAANMLVPTRQSPPSPAKLRQKRKAQSSSSSDNNGKLNWQTWRGSLTDGAVSIYNSYADRVEYVCKHDCMTGFYNSERGSYCHYASAGKEHRVSQFEILVNEDNFEILEWKKASEPPNSIRTCSSAEFYVGKNKYGLGKVHPKRKVFYLPYEGKEYQYTEYEVLTINKDVVNEELSNVTYSINEAETFQYPPETMGVSVITNRECKSVLQTATLSKTNSVERGWDISSSFKRGVTTTITTGIPSIISGNISISTEVSLRYSSGQTYSEEISHSISVGIEVPPNHNCKALMVGHKYKTTIPYTAHLSRTYRNGENKRTLITGTYEGVEVGEVRVEIDRCKPVTDPEPCSPETP